MPCRRCLSAPVSASRSGMPHHLDEYRTSVLWSGDLVEEVDASTLDPFIRLQPEREAQAIDRGHRRLGRFDPCMRPRQQDHRIDMVSVHVREDAGRGLGQRVRGSLFVVPRLDPAHHAKATDVVEIDGLEPEEAEVGEVDPVAAILVASEIFLPNRQRCRSQAQVRRCQSGLPGRPQAHHRRHPLAPTKRLHRGSAFRFWVCMAILLMRKMGRPEESRAKGIREPNGNPGCLRDSVDRVAIEDE